MAGSATKVPWSGDPVIEPSVAGPLPTLDELRWRFDHAPPGTVGIEEEALLVEAVTGRPCPVAATMVAAAADARIKPELAACQFEVATAVHRDVAGAAAEVRECRERVARACPPGVVPVAAAVHPLVDGPADLAPTPRSWFLDHDYREVVRRQLVSSMQVHVAVGGADRTVAVHDALRCHLPELAALAAAAPFVGGRDAGLCSVRPVIASQLPRQGVPPALGSWDRLVADLEWLGATSALPASSVWWWELRPHLTYGTLEVRVMDVQPDVARAAALAALVQALVAHLAAEHDAGAVVEPVPTWRIEENRWSALRDGVDGTMLDLWTGAEEPTRQRLHRLIDLAEPHAPRGLGAARELVACPLAGELRAAGPAGALALLAERYVRPAPGMAGDGNG